MHCLLLHNHKWVFETTSIDFLGDRMDVEETVISYSIVDHLGKMVSVKFLSRLNVDSISGLLALFTAQVALMSGSNSED